MLCSTRCAAQHARPLCMSYTLDHFLKSPIIVQRLHECLLLSLAHVRVLECDVCFRLIRDCTACVVKISPHFTCAKQALLKAFGKQAQKSPAVCHLHMLQHDLSPVFTGERLQSELVDE
eukprot:4876052-Amphidinium_carterae.1